MSSSDPMIRVMSSGGRKLEPMSPGWRESVSSSWSTFRVGCHRICRHQLYWQATIISWRVSLLDMSSTLTARNLRMGQIAAIFICMVRKSVTPAFHPANATFPGPDNSERLYKFRSPEQFMPHARWLFTNMSGVCLCEFCKRAPRVHKIPPSSPASPSTHQNAAGSHGEGPLSYKHLSDPSPRRTLSADVQLHRSGELLWLATHLCLIAPFAIGMDFWPSVVTDISTEIVKCNEDPSGNTFRQMSVYTVQLLGTSQRVKARGEDLIPFHGYRPETKALGD